MLRADEIWGLELIQVHLDNKQKAHKIFCNHHEQMCPKQEPFFQIQELR